MPLDLLVPDLLLAADAPPILRALRLPALEKWLAKSDVKRVAPGGAVAWLAAAFDLPTPAPVAALALAGENAPRKGSWLRADPVHLRIDRDAVALHDASILDVTKEEAAELLATLQAHFACDGLELHAPAPDRWYARVPEGELPATTSLERAFGRNVFGMLPEGKGRINWPAAITEAQMVLGAHAVNARREAAGRSAINSVWFWGEGSLPEKLARRYSMIYSDDVFARGLGAVSGAQVRPMPQKIADVDLVRDGDRVLAAIGALTPALHRSDVNGWRDGAEALERDWFQGLGEAIARFGEVRVILPEDDSTLVATLTPASRWRWFRARRPLTAHA